MIYTITGARMTELHPSGCDCTACHPTGIRARNETAAGPRSSLWVTLDENEAPPDGWHRVER